MADSNRLGASQSNPTRPTAFSENSKKGTPTQNIRFSSNSVPSPIIIHTSDTTQTDSNSNPNSDSNSNSSSTPNQHRPASTSLFKSITRFLTPNRKDKTSEKPAKSSNLSSTTSSITMTTTTSTGSKQRAQSREPQALVPLFGVDLRTLLELDKAHHPQLDVTVPLFLVDAINYIKAHVRTDGIFRVGGVKTEILALRDFIERTNSLSNGTDNNKNTTSGKISIRSSQPLPMSALTLPQTKPEKKSRRLSDASGALGINNHNSNNNSNNNSNSNNNNNNNSTNLNINNPHRRTASKRTNRLSFMFKRNTSKPVDEAPLFDITNNNNNKDETVTQTATENETPSQHIQTNPEPVNEQVNAGRKRQIFDYSVSESIHNVTGFLKMFFRELPSPLLEYSIYTPILAATQLPNEKDRTSEIKSCLEKLPAANRQLLRELLGLLHEISEECDVNRMDPYNLAVVLSPNLIWEPTRSNTLYLSSIHSTTSLVETLIENCTYFFPDIAINEKTEPVLKGKNMNRFKSFHFKSTMIDIDDDESALNEAKRLFDLHDPDKRGELSPTEFFEFFRELLVTFQLSLPGGEQCALIMKAIDTDGNNMVDWNEFLSFWPVLKSRPREDDEDENEDKNNNSTNHTNIANNNSAEVVVVE